MRYRLYIDESGDDDLTNCASLEHRYLSLSGAILHLDYVASNATPGLIALKDKFFPLADPDDDPVVFHRRKIIQAKGPFHPLSDPVKRRDFDRALMTYLRHTDFRVISVVLDKKAMLAKTYWSEKNPYHYCMQILVEKYILWLRDNDAAGDVMAEKRRGRKDTALCRAFEEVYNTGTSYTDAALISKCLAAKTLKLRAKSDNITGLQIADLVTHPSCLYIRHRRDRSIKFTRFARVMCNILERDKFYRSPAGRLWGYGIKFLP